MRALWLLTSLLMVLANVDANAADLPRRGILGLLLTPTEDGQALKIERIVNPNAAEVQLNDIVVSINGKPLSGPNGLGVAGATYGLKSGELARVAIMRAGKALNVTVTPYPAALPVLDGRPIELGAAQATGGPRVRTLFLEPIDKRLARNGRLPTVMILPGIPCGTVETFGDAGHPYTRLFKVLTAAGFAVGMADKPGQGDSEGTPCLDGGYDVEERSFSAAARAFSSDRRVDPKRFYMVGLSMGAIQAPIIAQAAPTAGIVTWGGLVSPWYEYLLTTFARRDILEGKDGGQIASYRRHWRRVLAALMVDGKSPQEIKRAMPDSYAAIVAHAGGDLPYFAGRSWTFHREVDRAPTVSAWNAFGGKLLAMHGEFDWVAEMHDHRLAVDIVNRQHPGNAEFEIVPGADHIHTKHKSLADSFAKIGQGEPDDAFFNRTAAWLVAQAEGNKG
ncbi:MAG: alpha/beta fold hydrolase [Micropepsaceae bacterium]